MAARAIGNGVAQTGAAIGATLGTIKDNPLDAPVVVAEKALKVCALVPSPVQGRAADAATKLEAPSDFQRVVGWVVVGAFTAAVPGELLFTAFLLPQYPDRHEGRYALAVFGGLVVASIVAWWNKSLADRGEAGLEIKLPPSWIPGIVFGLTVGIGWLIGRTIFR